MSKKVSIPVNIGVTELLLSNRRIPSIPPNFLRVKRSELNCLIYNNPKLDNYITSKLKECRGKEMSHDEISKYVNNPDFIIMVSDTEGEISEFLTDTKKEVNKFLNA